MEREREEKVSELNAAELHYYELVSKSGDLIIIKLGYLHIRSIIAKIIYVFYN